ncbi:MAG: hypothetical protein M1131_02070 [Actinobacteria bacterium]|nr:hypothetical protein [Actinomycetota bacterium]MCL6095702.1 hypothetical protein [Actinomycetota bacterium]
MSSMDDDLPSRSSAQNEPLVAWGDTAPSPPSSEKRVVVMSPKLRGKKVEGSGKANLTDLAEQTELGEMLLNSLMRTQLGLAIKILAIFGSILGGLPLFLIAVVALRQIHLFGVPLTWIILGALIYPLLFGLAKLYVHLAEKNEADFTDVVEKF